MELQNLVVRLIGNGTSLLRMYAQAQTATRQTVTVITAAGTQIQRVNQQLQVLAASAQKVGASMVKVGAALSLSLTAPLITLGVKSGKAFAQYETQLARIKALAGATNQEVKYFDESIRSMAASVGKMPAELAKGAYFITTGELRGKPEEAMDALAWSSKAATAGLGETMSVAKAATAAMSAYGTETLNAKSAVEIITAAVSAGNAEAEEFAPVFGRVLPLAANLGISFKELAGGLAFLTLASNDAPLAAAQIRGLLSVIPRLGYTSVRLNVWRKMVAETGYSVERLEDTIKNRGLVAAMVELDAVMKKANLKPQHLFYDVEARTGFVQFMNQLKKANAVMGETANHAGIVDRAFKIWEDTLAGRWAKTMAQLNLSLINLGELLLPVFDGIMEKLKATIAWWEGLDRSTRKSRVSFLVWVTTIGPLLAIFGTLSWALGNMVSTISMLTTGIVSNMPTLTAWLSKLNTIPTIAMAGKTALMGMALYVGFQVGRMISGILIGLSAVEARIDAIKAKTPKDASGLAEVLSGRAQVALAGGDKKSIEDEIKYAKGMAATYEKEIRRINKSMIALLPPRQKGEKPYSRENPPNLGESIAFAVVKGDQYKELQAQREYMKTLEKAYKDHIRNVTIAADLADQMQNKAQKMPYKTPAYNMASNLADFIPAGAQFDAIIEKLVDESDKSTRAFGRTSIELQVLELRTQGVTAAQEQLLKHVESNEAWLKQAALVQALTTDIEEYTKSLYIEAAAFGLEGRQLAIRELQLRGATDAQLARARAVAPWLDLQDKETERIKEQTKLIEEYATPMEKYANQIKKLQSILDWQGADQPTYNRAIEKLREELGQELKIPVRLEVVQQSLYDSAEYLSKLASYRAGLTTHTLNLGQPILRPGIPNAAQPKDQGKDLHNTALGIQKLIKLGEAMLAKDNISLQGL